MRKKKIRQVIEDLDFRDPRVHDDTFIVAVQEWMRDNAVADDEWGVRAALDKYIGEYRTEAEFVRSGVIEPDPWDVIREALENAGIEFVQWHIDEDDTVKSMDNTEGYVTSEHHGHWFWAAD